MELEDIVDYLAEKIVEKIRPQIYEILNASKTIKDNPPDEDELLTISEVIKLFKCSRATVYNWQKSGELKSYRKGNKVYYKKNDLLKGLKARS